MKILKLLNNDNKLNVLKFRINYLSIQLDFYIANKNFPINPYISFKKFNNNKILFLFLIKY